jgi:hypothetical protein
MIPTSVEAFRAVVSRLARKSFSGMQWEIQEQNVFRLKARALLSPGLLIDIFYSARTMRIDFALIKGAERVFGIDNLNGWHRHPFGEVGQHQAIREPTLEKIFLEIKDVVVEKGLLSKRRG